jgi:hypothetical protein
MLLARERLDTTCTKRIVAIRGGGAFGVDGAPGGGGPGGGGPGGGGPGGGGAAARDEDDEGIGGGGGAFIDSVTVLMIISRVSLSLRSLFLTPAAWNNLRHSGGILRIYNGKRSSGQIRAYVAMCMCVCQVDLPRSQHRHPNQCGFHDGSHEDH